MEDQALQTGPRIGVAGGVDWAGWRPTERASLCFIVSGSRILLIRKKRGLGKGKVTGPGGRLENGESALNCAVRETQEEVKVTPLAPYFAGLLAFQFTDGYALEVEVFRADDFQGQPQETDEAGPFWCEVDHIPYEEMWADDCLWMPLLLRRQSFEGRFLFDGEAMLFHQVRLETKA